MSVRGLSGAKVGVLQCSLGLAQAFNQPVNAWDTSSVTTMSYMFAGTMAFNQPLDSWDTSAVTDTLS